MWWEPRTEFEASLADAVRRLRGWYREQVSMERPVAWGVGSAWSYINERLEPFVLLNRELIDTERLGNDFAIPLPVPFESIQFAIQPARGGFNPLEVLPRFGGSLQLHAMAVGRPRMSSASYLPSRYIAFSDAIICKQTGRLGTAAVRVWDDSTGEAGLLTAGHVFPKGVGSPVDRRRRWMVVMWRREELGYVSHHVAPVGPAPAWDAAVIRFAKPPLFGWTDPVVKTIESFREPVPVVTHGAISGMVREAAVLQGALVEGGAGDKFRWNNCWMVAPSGVLTGGDSGAAVFTRTGEFLGLYVGSSDYEDTGTILTHYVQDARSLEKAVLNGWKVRFGKEAT